MFGADVEQIAMKLNEEATQLSFPARVLSAAISGAARRGIPIVIVIRTTKLLEGLT